LAAQNTPPPAQAQQPHHLTHPAHPDITPPPPLQLTKFGDSDLVKHVTGPDLQLAGFDGTDEWDTIINMLDARYSHGLKPLTPGGNDRCPGANKSIQLPKATASTLSTVGIAGYLNEMAKHGEDQDASDRTQFRALASGRGLPTLQTAKWEAIVAAAPLLFASTTLQTSRNSDNAKLRITRGLLMKHFGKRPTKRTIASDLEKTPLDTSDDNALDLLFTLYEQRVRSLGENPARSQETSIELFDKRIEHSNPAIHTALREMYFLDIRSNPDRMDALTDLEHLDPAT
jgi:hypothetical protein